MKALLQVIYAGMRGASGPVAYGAVTTFLMVISAPVAVAAPTQTHWETQLSVDPPSTANEPFKANLTVTLVGSRPGMWLSPPAVLTYRWAVTGPAGEQAPLTEKLSQWTSEPVQLTGTVLHSQFVFWPDQNGDWDFRIWQLDAGKETLAMEQKVATDKALQSPTLPPRNNAADTPLVSAIRIDPIQPVVGQPATVFVDMANLPLAAAIDKVPVNLVDDEGMHELGSIASPGPGKTGSLAWVPQQPISDGMLEVLGFSVAVVVENNASTPAPDGVEPDTTDPSSE